MKHARGIKGGTALISRKSIIIFISPTCFADFHDRRSHELRTSATDAPVITGGRARTFSWFGRNRRLAKDFENLAETLATFVSLASTQLALRRLARA